MTGRERESSGHLRALVRGVEVFIGWMDAEMKRPPSEDRGKRIARALNSLEMSKDIAKRFGLAKPKTPRRSKPAAEGSEKA